MRSQNNSFDWRGKPSELAPDMRRQSTKPKRPTPALTLIPRRDGASINTEKPRAKPVYSAE